MSDEDVVARETRAAQRGFLVITGAKVWFLLTGTVLNIGLPRMLGDPARFGDFGVVNTFISIFNMVVIAGGLQVVSKRVSEDPGTVAAVRSRALRLVAAVTVPLCCVIVAGADLLARDIFHDPSLAQLIRVAALITLAYGFYAVFIGVLNGLKRFTQQALFDIGFATLKLALILGAVLAGFSVMGAIAGFAAAALFIAVAAWMVTRPLASTPTSVARTEVAVGAFMVQVMGYTLMVNALLQGDVLVLKSASYAPVLDSLTTGSGGHQLAVLAATTGWRPEVLLEPSVTSSTAVLSGLYRATKNVSLISYQAVIAITFVVFPLVSRATFQSDQKATDTYVRQTVRVATLLVLFVSTLLAAGGEPLLALLFGDAYRLAAPALIPMLGAMACFALLFVCINILTAAGRPLDALLLTGSSAIVQLVALYLVISAAPAGPGVLALSAVVTLVSIAVALVLGAALVRLRLKVQLPWLSIARTGLAAGCSLVAAALAGDADAVFLGGLWGIFVRVSTALVVFAVMLFATREITVRDLRGVLGSVMRRG